MWGRILAQIAGAKAKQLPEPVRITRPGELAAKPPAKRVHTTRELAAWFSRTG